VNTSNKRPLTNIDLHRERACEREGGQAREKGEKEREGGREGGRTGGSERGGERESEDLRD